MLCLSLRPRLLGQPPLHCTAAGRSLPARGSRWEHCLGTAVGQPEAQAGPGKAGCHGWAALVTVASLSG
eukprot:2198357-Rhodomonas_salina.1